MLKLLINCLTAQAILVKEPKKNFEGNNVFQGDNHIDKNTDAQKTQVVESNVFAQDDDSKELVTGELDESLF